MGQTNLKSSKEQAMGSAISLPGDKYKKEISSLNTKIQLLETEKKQMNKKILESDKVFVLKLN